jgi:hypothetical protein
MQALIPGDLPSSSLASSELEKDHVFRVYDNIAVHWNHTRGKRKVCSDTCYLSGAVIVSVSVLCLCLLGCIIAVGVTLGLIAFFLQRAAMKSLRCQRTAEPDEHRM